MAKHCKKCEFPVLHLERGLCDICAEDARQARPWSKMDVQNLVKAAKATTSMLRPKVDHMPESERIVWRQLIDAIDRRYVR